MRYFLILVLVASLGIGFVGVAVNEHSACQQRQRQYDGEFTYTLFLAKEFHATPAQTKQGLADLRSTIGARPSC